MSDRSYVYYDDKDNEIVCTLLTLIKQNPEWAENRIKSVEKAEKRIKDLEALLKKANEEIKQLNEMMG